MGVHNTDMFIQSNHLLSRGPYLEYSAPMLPDVKGKKVWVGLSGGVDSAVSAALLQKAGAHVTGVFIKGWYPRGMPCTWARDRRDAMRVAAHLTMPFVTLDASTEYKKSVIDYLLDEYRAGRTPNPDVMCNRDIKFGVFYCAAMAAGADYLATGHYRDGDKDQSYFLWAVPTEVLAKTVFPLRGLSKPRVRALARRLGLPVADKPDSQGVCFLGSVSVKDFLRAEFGDNPAILHTLGERIDGKYIIKKDVGRGQLVVSTALPHTTRIHFSHAHWHVEPSQGLTVQYRYRGPLCSGHVERNVFVPHEPICEVVAPGQSIVFYSGGALAGGAIIE